MREAMRSALRAWISPGDTAREGYYLAVDEWLVTRADEGRRVVAVNGPQGAGKSTLCAAAVAALAAAGRRAVTVSIDD